MDSNKAILSRGLCVLAKALVNHVTYRLRPPATINTTYILYSYGKSAVHTDPVLQPSLQARGRS